MSAKIEQDFTALLRGERSAHLSYLAYGEPLSSDDKVHGAEYWDNLYHNDSYYVTPEDNALMASDMIKEIGEIIRVDTLIDLGPGGMQSILDKTIPLLKTIHATSYIAVDMAEQYAANAAETVSVYTHVRASSSVSDFIDSKLSLKAQNALIYIGGCTLGNISTPLSIKNPMLSLSQALSRIRKASDKQCKLLLSFDANQDQESLTKAYSNEDSTNFVEDIPRRIVRDAPYSFDPILFRYSGKWMKDEHRYAHFLVAKKDFEITNTLSKEAYFVQNGEAYHVINSFKFPVPVMEQAAQNAGWKAMQKWTRTGRVHYMLFEAF